VISRPFDARRTARRRPRTTTMTWAMGVPSLATIAPRAKGRRVAALASACSAGSGTFANNGDACSAASSGAAEEVELDGGNAETLEVLLMRSKSSDAVAMAMTPPVWRLLNATLVPT
jgi:hypothetical protein